MASATTQSAEEVRNGQVTSKPPEVPNGRVPAFARLFPLGYKEGFNQWVCVLSFRMHIALSILGVEKLIFGAFQLE